MTPFELVTAVTLSGFEVTGVVVNVNGYECNLYHGPSEEHGPWVAQTIGEDESGEPTPIIGDGITPREALDKVVEWRRQLDFGEIDAGEHPWEDAWFEQRNVSR